MRPNILYIHSHDTGRYIQPYGFAVKTPALQKFAEEGILFRQAFCAAPTCSPSRAALLTGQYAHSCGMLGLSGKRGCTLNDPNQHLSHYLKSQGYVTALSGIQHESIKEGDDGLGYDHRLDLPWPAWADSFEKWNELYAENAAAFLLRADREKPFFLSCGFSLTHRMGKGEQWHTMKQPPEGDPRFVRPPLPLPDTPETRQDFADFIVAAGHLDRGIARILEALDRSGQADNTLVIITTDHGLASPKMKCNLTDHGLGVMLMMRGPGGFKGGRAIDALVSQVDLFPTICEVADLPKPAWLQGTSLLPLVNGEKDSVRDEVFGEVNWHGYPEPTRAVRTERFKYIRRFLQRPASDNCDASISRSFFRRHGWSEQPRESEEFYDLIFDPNEACNRADDPAYAKDLEEMRGRLERWMCETSDPALSGRIEPKPGMITNIGDKDLPHGKTAPAEVVIFSESH